MSGERHIRQWPWFLQGVRGIFSAPAFILMVAFVGFCGFAFEAGIPLGQTLFMTAAVWALPAQIVLIGALLAGVSLPTAAIAVALSSMRLMPMVAGLIPHIRTKSTPTWLLLVLSHFVAVTAWVFTMQRIHTVPREGRVAFFAGFGLSISLANIILVAITYDIISHLPALLAGGLFLLTPIYFLTSIWATARTPEIYYAMIFGLVLGPVFHVMTPQFGLLLAGVLGGTAAFAIERSINAVRKRSDGG